MSGGVVNPGRGARASCGLLCRSRCGWLRGGEAVTRDLPSKAWESPGRVSGCILVTGVAKSREAGKPDTSEQAIREPGVPGGREALGKGLVPARVPERKSRGRPQATTATLRPHGSKQSSGAVRAASEADLRPDLMLYPCTGMCVSCRNTSRGRCKRETDENGGKWGRGCKQFGDGLVPEKVVEIQVGISGCEARVQPHRSCMGASDSEAGLGGGEEGEAPYRMWGWETLASAMWDPRADGTSIEAVVVSDRRGRVQSGWR